MNLIPRTNTRSGQPPSDMFGKTKRCLVVGLGLCFLFASLAFTVNQPSVHHHQGHHKQAHSQTWCSWSCQAGQAVSAGSFILEISEELLHTLEFSFPLFSIVQIFHLPSSRAPPTLGVKTS